MILAVATALVSAACFATGSALQHRVADESSDTSSSSARFLGELARRPSWLFGLALSAVAFGLHALALGLGDLTLVQPVIVSGVVFAVLIRAGLDHSLPPPRTISWLIITWLGLALFLMVRPAAPPASLNGHAAWFVIAGCLGAMSTLLASRKVARDRYRGLMCGAAAGVLFGLVAGLVKVVIVQAGDGWTEIFRRWPLWALIAVGACAVLVNQRAYQATRLSVTTPMLNIAQVIVALAFGVVVLNESLGSSLPVRLAEIGGLVLVVIGIWKLAAQPARPAASERDRAAV